MKLIKNNLPSGRQAFFIILLTLSFLGFLDAAYLTILHYKNAFPPCTITSGCETVLTSKYAAIYGIPISLIGSLFYLLLIVLSLLLLTAPRKFFLNILMIIAASGVLVSLVLIYIQFGILKAYCQYCLISEIISFLIFGLAFLFFHLQSNKGH
ncbi:MAG: hypothetical protein A3H50_03240 [Candidatus Levybacteria bacterium RIFCSPLOWO2_02_FULL_37_10]|nr:MAG: hypothetical protein A2860_02965 [Candidatus Levybacteria bacterium RIFCSPHIGHO2_01_FULL_37_33]OGH16239.1 MAG: hypothetical protein A3C97_02955 [Candidatus Levybacteria bacterium RIFCSPHIGHO2_02_FULL_37_11]OGH29499.1 MAG: hypothetical protein A3F30_02590 [Candidatus Levybacteria bacterium RIFCSPHIGHO2_12_FULL_37_12]OGH43609.1 MAG: hypothetical protein A3H50_03240 [Candidatus Levybacteria bacterium RIFCSPLOWO2_02_FULL_37_10]